MSAGYSSTPLLQKLGIKPGSRLLVVNAPDNYNDLLGADVSSMLITKKQVPDMIHLFVTSMTELRKELNSLKPLVKKNSSIVIWVSWYKKSSKQSTDVTEDHIRDLALQNDLVDIKVCAVSDLWSGLKLVVPLAKR
jgi:hypothetical protein